MGRSPKPLTWQIDPALVQTPEDTACIEALRGQGHTISLQAVEVDILLAPNAWRAFDLNHLDLAMKSARAVKYVKKPSKPKKPRAARKKKGDPGPEHE